MDHRSPNVYRTRSSTTRRRALTALGGVVLLLTGYAIGRWQDTPAEVAAPVVPAAATGPAPASGSPAPASAAPASPSPVAIEYAVLQAESATELAGIDTQGTEDSGGGLNAAWINRNDHLRFDNVEFGAVAATKARLRLSSGAGVPGRVELRLDSKDNAPVGEVSISNTGGWQEWRTVTAALTPITGVHTVFVTFTAPDDSEFVNVNWLQFAH